MKDNDPKHTSRVAKAFFAENGVNWWRTPPESPDVNPIENLWHELKVSEAYSELQTYMHYISFHDIATVSYELHACLALCNLTSLACLMLAGMACSMQLVTVCTAHV